MSRDDRSDNSVFGAPRWMVLASAASLVAGIAALILGFAAARPVDAWLWLVVWFLVFGGIAQGMLGWAAVFRVAQARWTPAVNRIGHSAVGFLPAAYLVLIVLLTGLREFVPWVEEPVPEKAAWLNVPFMAARQLAAVGALFFLYFLMVRWSLQADAKAVRGEEITERDHYRMNALAVATTITYAVVLTVISYDFIMSLSPEWFSTMFGPYYFVTTLYLGLATLIVLGALLRRPLGVVRYIEAQQFQDMGNLMLAFGLFCMGLFFAQYLTIWYGNLPLETEFLIVRYLRGPWPVVGWAAFMLGYGLPFVLLQSRALKRRPGMIAPVAGLAILGVALERYVLVVPSVAGERLMLSPLTGLSVLAFLGAFVLAVLVFLSRYPAVSAAQEALRELDRLEAVR